LSPNGLELSCVQLLQRVHETFTLITLSRNARCKFTSGQLKPKRVGCLHVSLNYRFGRKNNATLNLWQFASEPEAGYVS